MVADLFVRLFLCLADILGEFAGGPGDFPGPDSDFLYPRDAGRAFDHPALSSLATLAGLGFLVRLGNCLRSFHLGSLS